MRALSTQTPYAVYYGLAEIAAKSGRNKEARKFYEEFLTSSPKAPEAEAVKKRLKELR